MNDAGQMIHDTWHIIHDEYVQYLHKIYIYTYSYSYMKPCILFFLHRYNLCIHRNIYIYIYEHLVISTWIPGIIRPWPKLYLQWMYGYPVSGRRLGVSPL